MYRAHTQHKDIHTLGSKRVVVDGGNRSASAGIDKRLHYFGCVVGDDAGRWLGVGVVQQVVK